MKKISFLVFVLMIINVSAHHKKPDLSQIMNITEVFLKDLYGNEILVNHSLIDGEFYPINYLDSEDHFDFADFFVGDYRKGHFRLKINYKNPTEKIWYNIEMSEFIKEDEKIVITSSKLLKQISSDEKGYLSLKIPEEFVKNDFYFISVNCQKISKRGKVTMSPYLRIKFLLGYKLNRQKNALL